MKLEILETMSKPQASIIEPAVRRRRAIGINVILLILSSSVGLALTEGLLVFLVPPPIVWLDPQESYYFDPTIGHRLVPRQHSYTHSFPVVTNSYGLRDHEFSAVPGSGVVRILCLGDSLTFGDGVAAEDTYAKQLEARLGREDKIKYEVINAGVPSYDTWQEVAYFEKWGGKLKPNTVVIGFYANDVVPKPERIEVPLTGDGTLRRQGFGGVLPDFVVHLLKRSRLLLFLRDRVGKISNLISPSVQILHQQSLLEGTENNFTERGWEEVDASLKKMVILKKEQGFDLLLVIFPMAEQLLREYPRAQYQARVEAIASKYGIPSIDLLDSFKQEFKGFGSMFIEWDGHPGPNAYRIAAEEIARFIRAKPKSG